MLGIRI